MASMVKLRIKQCLYSGFYLLNLAVFILLLLPATTTNITLWWLDNLINLQVQWASLALLLLLINLFWVKKLKLICLFLYAVTSAYNLLPLYCSPATTNTQTDNRVQQPLSIAQVNLSYTNPYLAQLLPTLGDARFDILVLQEASDNAFANIQKLTRYYPYSFGINEHEATPSGLAILSRYPIIEKKRHDTGDKSGNILEVIVQPTDSTIPIQLYALHPSSPRTEKRWLLRNEILTNLAQRIVHSPFAHQIVIGDFNSSPWSGALQRFMNHSQLKNSASGFGYIPSWSYSKNPLFLLLSSAYIDHCLLSSAFKVINKHAQPLPGSDHQLIFTQLQL